MIDLEAAAALVRRHTSRLPVARLPVAMALGHALAEAIVSDIDSPPHDKSMVDGYAIQRGDLATGAAVLRVLEEVTAGEVPSQTVIAGHATRIMTGAPIPAGADAVVMIEQTELLPANEEDAGGNLLPRVAINDQPPAVGQHILPRGTSLRRGDQVLPAGHVVRGIEVGLLSEVGQASVPVFRRPRVAVLSTGNELVEADQTPGPGQIRNSNGPMLTSLALAAGAEASNLGVARDTRDDLRRLIASGLEADVLLLSGGVSAGVLDLVPSVLAELGVRQVFHKVRLRPGKPLWFGVANQTLVFGLPGNPVSGLVGFVLLVRPALAQLAGRDPWDAPVQQAALTDPQQQRGERPTYFPAKCQAGPAGISVTPLPWQGSADLRTLSEANCLIHFPAGDRDYQAGDQVEVVML